MLKRWTHAEVVRRLIAVVEDRVRHSGGVCTEDLGRWLERTRRVAASLDPLSDGLEGMLARHKEAADAVAQEGRTPPWAWKQG